MYTGGKVIGIAERTKIKTDSSLIFQFLYLFFRFYTIIVLDYFSVTAPVFADEISIVRFPRISVPVSVDGNNYATHEMWTSWTLYIAKSWPCQPLLSSTRIKYGRQLAAHFCISWCCIVILRCFACLLRRLQQGETSKCVFKGATQRLAEFCTASVHSINVIFIYLFIYLFDWFRPQGPYVITHIKHTQEVQ